MQHNQSGDWQQDGDERQVVNDEGIESQAKLGANNHVGGVPDHGHGAADRSHQRFRQVKRHRRLLNFSAEGNGDRSDEKDCRDVVEDCGQNSSGDAQHEEHGRDVALT